MASSVWVVPLIPHETRGPVVTDFPHVKIMPKGSSNCFWFDAKSCFGEVTSWA